MEIRKPVTVAMLSAALAVSVGVGLVSAPTAEAACGSFLGVTVGDSAQCSSTFGNVAIALGPTSTAHAGNPAGLTPGFSINIPSFGAIAIASGTGRALATGWFSLAAATGTVSSQASAAGIGTAALAVDHYAAAVGIGTAALAAGNYNGNTTTDLPMARSVGILSAATALGEDSTADTGYVASTATAIGNNSHAKTAGFVSNSLALGNNVVAQAGDVTGGGTTFAWLSNAVAVFNDQVARANGNFILAINEIKPVPPAVSNTAPAVAAMTTDSGLDEGDKTLVESSDDDPVEKRRAKVDKQINNKTVQDKADKQRAKVDSVKDMVRDEAKDKVDKVRDKKDPDNKSRKKDRDKKDGDKK